MAICAVMISVRAADWTDADGNTYTALKYIKGNGSGATGGPYIITDFKPVSNSTVKLRFRPTTVSGTDCLFCSRKPASSKVSNSMSGFRISNKIRLDRYHTTRYVTCNTTSLEANNDYSLSADFKGGTATTGIATINGIDQTLSPALGNTAYTPASKLTLFASHEDENVSASSTFDNKGSFYLYYFQLYSPDDGSLAHNMMPAKNSNGVAGLYDTVTRTFYGPTGPSGYETFATEAYADRAGKKWTGLGADNKMSNGDNWQGGVAPSAGDDIDFTIAVPFAAIDADIDATFGKVYLGTGDIPAFTGSLSATAINDLTRMQAYDAATAGFTFTLAAPTGQDFTWNGGAAANWWATDAWTYNSAASVWYDYNTAVFNTANATATLDDNVSANSLAFDAPATIGGAATLTVPTVSVAQNVSATIAAPTTGTLAKTGAGTLTLESSRADATILNEGTLALSGAASLDWSQFTFGTDPAKPVALDVGAGATLANIPSAWEIGYGANITSSVVKAGGDWTNTYLRVGGASGAAASFYHNGGSLTLRGASKSAGLIVGYASGAGASYFELNDSTVTCLSYPIIGNSSAGEMVVTNNGSLVSSGSVYIGRDSAGYGILTVVDGGTVSTSTEGSLVFNSASAAGIGVVNLANGGVISAKDAYRGKAGSATFNFDGGTFVKAASGTGNVFPVNGADSAIDVSVSTNGGTIDNNGLTITIPCTITGAGGLTLSGAGTTTVSADQSYTGTTTVSNGTTLAVSGVTFAGPLALEAGSTLNLVSYTPGVTPVVASALALPESGTVALTLNGGAFPVGVYAICSATGVAASDGDKFVPSTGGGSFAWSVSGNTLVLTVGEVSGNMWTGLAGDGRISSAANWLNGVPAADADIDFSSVVSAVTINADLERTFGTVTMGEGVITFTNAIAATNFTDTSKISVGADSTVTIVGDLEISGETSRSIVYTIAAGGRFVVTGDIIATEEFTGDNLYPSATPTCPGMFVARGLVSSGKGRTFRLVQDNNSSRVTWVIGDHGITSRGQSGELGSAGFWCFGRNGSSATIIADTNITIAAWITIGANGRLVLNTTGTDGTPHTITVGNGTTGQIYYNGVVETTGAGKVLFNCVSTFSGGHPVYGTSTVAVNPGCRAGNNTIHLYEGTSLEVAQSGTVTLAGDLKLDNNTALAFNFTESANPPVLALATGKSVIFTSGASTNIAVKVSGARPRGGEKVLTTCGGFNTDGVNVSLAEDVPNWVKGLRVNDDGNLVLDVKPRGLIISVQ